MLTQSRLKELLHYCPDTGVFTWQRARQGVRVGCVAGGIGGEGYRSIRVDGRNYLAHRLAWLYVYGEWPKDQIDHINGVKDDNRIANLREATNAENNQNLAMRSSNKSGFVGVHWHSRDRKWHANIRINMKRKFLGRFNTPESAHAAYLAAKAELHTFNPTVRA